MLEELETKNSSIGLSSEVLPWLEHGFQEAIKQTLKILSDNHYTIAPCSCAQQRSMLRSLRRRLGGFGDVKTRDKLTRFFSKFSSF